MKAILLTFFSAFCTFNSFCQKNDIITDVEELMKGEKFQEANALVKNRINTFLSQKNIDTIADYVGYLGKSTAKINGDKAAKTALELIQAKATSIFPKHRSLIAIYFESASYFSNAGDHELAYQTLVRLQDYFIAADGAFTPETLSALYSNKGDYAQRQGKYALASDNYLKAIAIMKAIKNPDQQKLYFANNSLGIVMWYSSKLDSALIFFQRAVDALNKMEDLPLNRHYRVALVQNNMAGCYNVLGKPAEAIKTYESVIDHNRKFIQSPDPHPKKEMATINQFQSVDNLAKVYLDLGDISKAHDLLYYSYQQKLGRFGDKSPEVYKSLIFLGTIYNNQRDFTKARNYLNDALKRMLAMGDINNGWGAEVYWQLAVAAKGLKNNAEAKQYFEHATNIFETVYAGQYDDLYLNYLGEMSMFYAGNDEPALAINSINQGLAHVLKSQGEKSLQAVLQLKNLASVNFILKKYDVTSNTAGRALGIIDQMMAQSTDMMDSVKIEMEKPGLILLRSKAQYEQIPAKKDTAALSALLQQLYLAKNILDKRKSILFSEKDITALIANNNDLLDFIKKLNYELYNGTGKADYLDKMIGMHEAGMYARIRSRMDKQKAIRFSKVPENIIDEENKLRAAIDAALKASGSHDVKINNYLTAMTRWKLHHEMIRKQYPAYYNMRYAGNEKPIKELTANIPAGITVLRYLFSGNDLFVLVATSQQQQLVSLSSNQLAENIAVLNNPQSTPAQSGKAGFTLYQQLWAPAQREIKNNRVMIIPDNILYNLSFEMLTPVQTNNHGEMAAVCLLNKYAIGYHFSLLAIEPSQSLENAKDNFVGFSPEFSDEQKKQYSASIKSDSLHLDNTYLSLLPLPFTTSLTKKIKGDLGGSLFLNNESTINTFRTKAGGHSIIHIGTHAESNNNHPEYSRLIFAKDPQTSNAENSVYLFDIYNCDLRSDLSILTACESGKPGYQDGEGMLSMAHAFNYAGSQSILTALWKIDEQVSTFITDQFYKNLQAGMSKDVALQQAKLHYLKNNEGRLLAPQYWAGLVIMGDTSPVQLKPAYSKWWWIGGAAIAVALIAFFWYRRKLKFR